MGFWDDTEKQDKEYEVVTPGNYTALLSDATLDTTYRNAKGVKYPVLTLRWKIEGSTFDGRLLFQDIRFMDSLKWKVHMELSRLDCVPLVSDNSDWETVAETAAGLVFEKVGKEKALLQVTTREWDGKTFNDVGIKTGFGDLNSGPLPSSVDTEERIPF